MEVITCITLDSRTLVSIDIARLQFKGSLTHLSALWIQQTSRPQSSTRSEGRTVISVSPGHEILPCPECSPHRENSLSREWYLHQTTDLATVCIHSKWVHICLAQNLTKNMYVTHVSLLSQVSSRLPKTTPTTPRLTPESAARTAIRTEAVSIKQIYLTASNSGNGKSVRIIGKYKWFRHLSWKPDFALNRTICDRQVFLRVSRMST